MKYLQMLLLAFTSGLALAGDSYPNWEHWRLDISPKRCLLIRNYYIPTRSLVGAGERGFLSNSPYVQAHVRFGVTTKKPYPEFPADQVRQIRFAAQIVPGYDVPDEDRIVQVDIGSFSVDNRYGTSNRLYSDDHWLSEEQTAVIMNRLENEEAINLTFHLASGQQLSTTLYPPGNKDFYVWRQVFETCVKTNTR